MNKFLYICFFFLIHQIGVSQEHGQLSKQAIPFELTAHNNISVESILNKKDTINLMFHTAVNDISIIKNVADSINTIRWNTKTVVKSWGGNDNARSSLNNILQIKEFEWDHLTIWDCKHSGPETDGKFGLHLFKDQAVEIDFDNNTIHIYDSLPSKAEHYQQFALKQTNGMLFIEGLSTVGGHHFSNSYLIHSGYGGTILYDDKFVESSQIGTHLEIVDQKELKDSYGNIIKVNKAKLPTFKLGDFEFNDVPVGFFEGAIGRQHMSVMGGGFLKRFNIIIDAERKYIYLKPNSLTSLPFSYQ